MTISSVTRMWSRETSREESQDGRTFSVSYEDAYQVVHDVTATQDEIRHAPGVPVVRDLYPGTLFVFCTEVQVEKVGPILSIVSVRYAGEVGPDGGNDSPSNSTPRIRYYAKPSEEPTDTDAYGFPLTNVNGDPVFGLTAPVVDMVLEVERNYAAFSGSLALQYMQSTNSDNFNVLGDTWSPGQAAMTAFNVVPVYQQDVISYFTVSSTIELRQPYNTVPARAWWHRYRNEGLYERAGVTVEFSSGGGQVGATAYAVTNSSGAITKIVVTNRGRGYFTPPTVTITGDGGSGASATAAVNASGEVTSVTVSSGGTGYKSKLIRAVDENKQPVTQPVLLKANGEREPDAGAAVFCERPKKLFSLPYTALGLLS